MIRLNKMRKLNLSLALVLLTGSVALPAGPPPPRDAGPQRFYPPAPRVPLFEIPPTAPELSRSTGAAALSGATQNPPETTAPPVTATTTTTMPVAAISKTPAISPPPRAEEAIEFGANDPVELAPPPAAFQIGNFDALPAKRGLVALHYPASNEYRIDLFRPALKDLGGGYLGVGTDQNLTFIAWARSDYAWLVDFDPVSVGINKIHLFFLRQAREYAVFRRLWSPALRKTARSLVEAEFLHDPYRAHILRAFDVACGPGAPVSTRLTELDTLAKKHGLNTFHNNKDDYKFLRSMALAGRIQALPGDLRGTTTLRNINEAARAMRIPIRAAYLSNAEDYFKTYPASFRANFSDLPGDERSIIVRTVSKRNFVYGQPAGEKFPKTAPFHYNVQTLTSFKTWLGLSAPFSIALILDERTPRAQGYSTVEKSPPRPAVKKTAPLKKPGA